MKSTSCIKKDFELAVCYAQRTVTYPCGIKINNALYSHQSLKNYLGTNVLVIKGRDCLRVYDTRRKFICVAEKSLDFPKQERKTAHPEKKPYTMEIHESLEQIKEGEVSDMGLFELSIRALMPNDVFKELKRRLELIRSLLKDGKPDVALGVVTNLLKNPQETRRTA